MPPWVQLTKKLLSAGNHFFIIRSRDSVQQAILEYLSSLFMPTLLNQAQGKIARPISIMLDSLGLAVHQFSGFVIVLLHVSPSKITL
jgi:hypothetical protein